MTATGSWLEAAWMQTYTGRAFRPFDPDPSDVDPRDIAHALSQICRYGGHTSRFYSVAEHCVLMSWAFDNPAVHADPDDALWALLHDAAEAYIGDMVRPLKVHLSSAGYGMVEAKVEAAIWRRFGLWDGEGMVPAIPARVKEFDNRILLDEREELLTAPPQAWEQDELRPLGVGIHGWSPLRAESAYRDRLDALLTRRSRR